jgi:hypothetical protein
MEACNIRMLAAIQHPHDGMVSVDRSMVGRGPVLSLYLHKCMGALPIVNLRDDPGEYDPLNPASTRNTEQHNSYFLKIETIALY